MTGSSDSCPVVDLGAVAGVTRKAGMLAHEFFCHRHARVVDEKTLGDFVSDADRAVEGQLRRDLTHLAPGIPIVGEEFGGETSDFYWSVDPIDGTSNFLSGLPFWGVSVGLVRNGSCVLGSVCAPALLLELAADTRGAKHVVGFDNTSSGMPAPSFGVGRNNTWPSDDRQRLEARLSTEGKSVVSLGSCALSLLYVATGRMSGYVEHGLGGLWDCAGGIAICNALGVAASYTENPDQTVNVQAGGVLSSF